jgi:ribosomal protein S12 methylthiotransferase accessory factor
MNRLDSSLRCFPQLAPYLIDERVGIVHQLDEVRTGAGHPNFFHFFSQLANTGSFSQQASLGRADSSAADRETAATRALSQSLAYYCAAYYELERYPLSSAESLSLPHVDPDQFAFYSREQYDEPGFSWLPFENNIPIRWAAAVDPLAGDVVHVPAAMVFHPYEYVPGSGDAPIMEPTLEGLECRCDPAEAAVGALCKVIANDALAVAWQGRLSPPQLRIETLSDENYELVSRFEKIGGTVVLLNITFDLGVTTILAVLRSEAIAAPALVFAGAADLDPERAVRHSLEKLARAERLSRQIKANVPPLASDRHHENVVTQVDHLNFWSNYDNLAQAEFVFASKERIEFSEMETAIHGDPRERLRFVLNAVRGAGYQALLADITPADVRDLGLTAVRAIIPGFHPLFIGHRMRALGGKRLWELPAKLGYKGLTRESGDNPAPHPFLQEQGWL